MDWDDMGYAVGPYDSDDDMHDHYGDTDDSNSYHDDDDDSDDDNDEDNDSDMDEEFQIMFDVNAPEQKKNLGTPFFKNLANFENLDEFSDVEVKVENESFKCHKIILVSWSLYFKALFSCGLTEAQTAVVTLTSIDPGDFKLILEIMYKGESEINTSNVEGLIFTANYLQISAIQDECENYMLRKIKMRGKNAETDLTFHYLQIAEQLQLKSTTKQILDKIIDKIPEFTKCSNMHTLSYENMIYILDSELIRTSEESTCDFLFKWLEHDINDREKHMKKLLPKIRYLILPSKYREETFLSQPQISASKDLDFIRAKCKEYEEYPLRQGEYIGEVEATHRYACKAKSDVIAVIYPSTSSLVCLEWMVGIDGNGSFAWVKSIPIPPSYDLKTAKSVSACSYGRSEMYVSTGSSLFKMNENCTWSIVCESKLRKDGNCLLSDPFEKCLYSVTVDLEGIFIERYNVRGSSTNQCQIIDVELLRQNRPKAISSKQTKTCAYMVQSVIFMLHTCDKFRNLGDSDTAIIRFNPLTKNTCYITQLPISVQCSSAVVCKNLVFLIDENGQHVLRVSQQGTCVDKYGQIDHDNTLAVKRQQFGVCFWRGRLFVAGGIIPDQTPEERSKDKCKFLEYDLDSHRTTKCTSDMYYGNMQMAQAEVVKMTIKNSLFT